MKYEKPLVEVINFDKDQEFLVFSPAGGSSSQNAEAEGRAHAMEVMGWNNPSDQIIVQKGYDGKWMAYCTFVNGQTGNVYCDRF